jgi:hypothetical protein
LFLIIVNVLGHPKGVGGLTSNFLCGGGMDVFWNDPYRVIITSTATNQAQKKMGRDFDVQKLGRVTDDR